MMWAGRGGSLVAAVCLTVCCIHRSQTCLFQQRPQDYTSVLTGNFKLKTRGTGLQRCYRVKTSGVHWGDVEECAALRRPNEEQQLLPVWKLLLQTTHHHGPLKENIQTTTTLMSVCTIYCRFACFVFKCTHKHSSCLTISVTDCCWTSLVMADGRSGGTLSPFCHCYWSMSQSIFVFSSKIY